MANYRQQLVLLSMVSSAALAASAAEPRPTLGECPQPRFTGKAPDTYYRRQNPLSLSDGEMTQARQIFEGKAGRANCALCHGVTGNGKGPLATLYDPPPRNFACAQTVSGIPDGQLFWIIRFGSPGTGMPPNPQLDDRQIWQLVLYLRHLAK
jgi:mono/diheme cytochrome c family protein